MESIVVDANIVFAALTKRGFTFEFIKLLSRLGVKLYSPQYILEEFDDNMEELVEASKLSREELKFLIKILFEQIKVIPESEYKASLHEAQMLFPEHLEDAPYLALSIAFDCPLWSNEKLLREQSRVKVLPTHELKLLI